MELAKRWRWLGIEFVVIVLGVLSALFVDTWMQDRDDAQRADEYRERLIADLEGDLSNLDGVIEYYRHIRTHGLATLGDLEGDQRMDDFELMFSAFNAAEEWGFVLEASTYNDMLSTGTLSLLEDVQFRLDLADYHRLSESRRSTWSLPRDYRATARGIIPNELQAAIHEICVSEFDSSEPLSAAHAAGAVMPASNRVLMGSAVMEQECGMNRADFQVARAAEELRSDPEIRRLLRFRNSEVRVAIALFQGQREMAVGLLERLRAED